MTVMGKPYSGTLLILRKHWGASFKQDSVAVRCPCCTKITVFKGKKTTIFDKFLRHCQASIIMTLDCGCLDKQKAQLDDYHEMGANWGDLV